MNSKTVRARPSAFAGLINVLTDIESSFRIPFISTSALPSLRGEMLTEMQHEACIIGTGHGWVMVQWNVI